MSRHLAARVAALVVPAVLLTVPAAHAEKVVTEDAVGDVVSYAELPDGSSQLLPAPDQAGVDIVRTAVDHGNRRLRITVRFRALERDPFHFTVVRVVTPKGNFDLAVERLGGKPIASLEKGRASVDCRGLKAKVDLGSDTVTTSVATSCLGAPRWVQVGVGAVAVAEDPSSPEMIAAFADDGHRDGTIRESTIKKGPRIHRG